MLESCTKEERWASVDEMISRWLQERQSLIVDFCAVSGVHQFTPNTPRSISCLQTFCQLLLDYVSAGHFEIYYELIREAEAFEDGSAKLGKTLLPLIQESTEVALDFNDKYASRNDTGDGVSPDLSQSLSALGETLVSRFDYEDQLINAMHKAHAMDVA